MKNKATYRGNLTREQIEAYRSGSNADHRKIEGAVSGGFDQDALEGWRTSPTGINSMKQLDKKFMRKFNPAIYIAGIGIALIIAAFFFARETPVKHSSSKDPVQLSVEQSDVVIAPRIDSMKTLPEGQQIRISSLKVSQGEIQLQSTAIPTTTIEEIPEIVLKPLELSIPETKATISKQKQAKEIYLADLKLIDYSVYRNKAAIETEQIMLYGTPADQENSGQTETESTVSTISIPYMDYLEKTMVYIGKNKWKQSLERLQIILETYPDDVNAHFYAGFCSYNLRQFDNAKQHFAACLQLPFSNFNEEATWYWAQSLFANGEKSQAKELFTAIRDQKGYYSKQAEKTLNGFK